MKKSRPLVLVLISAVAVFLLNSSIAFAACGTTSSGFQNPLNVCDIQSFVATALKALVIIALPIITVFIVISGFMFVFARGNEGKLTKAKENFVYVIIGAILILGAWVLATLIGGTVTQVLGQ